MADLAATEMFSIPGRWAVITGGGSGLGKMIAKCFLVNGASIILIDIVQSRLEEVQSEFKSMKRQLNISGEVNTIQGDLSSSGGIQYIISRIQEMRKDIDILVNAAGIRRTNRLSFEPGQGLERLVDATQSLSWDDLEASFRINLFAQYFLTAGLLNLLGAAAKKGEGRGCIICFSSVAARHNGQFVPAYQTSKAAVDHLVRIMAAEFADHYIRVNAISPGLFPSRMNPVDPNDPDSNMKFAADMPARRPGTEQELVAAALYLASPAGAYVTGSNLSVDGGRMLVAAGRISKM